ncbi:hypothetical protein [Streptomyces rugosispiralis]|uniref:PE-PGRS family protein n=1 Tax=Streptomyces rugosispiralis TaxID=2967341 RepID=A0ABT1V4U4_9ACTN|nr:hypothetical protein [Streptomyces rugosispiralis]MCQ8192321.1 hypothetical protein [Streptomyces rugosispiralis]
MVAETYRGNGGALDSGGAPGAAGSYGATGPSGVGYNGMDGGSGGPGGTGGVGGPAAEIVVETVAYTGLWLDGAGGAPGAAGFGGRGGTGGRHGGENGPAGPPGSTGSAAGPGVEPRLLVHSDADWWGVVWSRLGGRAAEWAHYRTAVGEFLFRSYAPGLPERSGHRDTAAHEFDRALALDPGQERAAELSRYIATNLAPIGQPYNLAPCGGPGPGRAGGGAVRGARRGRPRQVRLRDRGGQEAEGFAAVRMRRSRIRHLRSSPRFPGVRKRRWGRR